VLTPRPERATRRRHPVRTFLVAMAALVMVPVLLLGGVALYLEHRLTGQVHRIDDVFTGLSDRPDRATGAARGAVNILLLGTDRRSDEPTTGRDARAAPWLPGAQRSDAIMVLHIDADRRGASVISVPRDAWVPIPGHGMGKINAAFSHGGPSLAVHTVEQLTGVRIDHLAVVDWDGFRHLTDQLGGVTLDIPRTVHDRYRDITWTAGRHRLNGDQALAYVGQRAGLPGGDFDRIHRQQYFLRTLLDETLTQELVRSPRKAYGILDVLTENLSIDSDWSVAEMRRLLLSLRHLRSAGIEYMTVPLAGTAMEGAQSVVHLDAERGRQMWRAVRSDAVTDWLVEHPDDGIPVLVS
jgi:LCP family protein required for cell wall assembly